jgi:hypothetical protein
VNIADNAAEDLQGALTDDVAGHSHAGPSVETTSGDVLLEIAVVLRLTPFSPLEKILNSTSSIVISLFARQTSGAATTNNEL